MDGLIYNQNHIPKDEHRYGFRSSAATGCGWIATHNALQLMGYRTDIDELIRYYEWQLPLVHGNAGTSFWAPGVCFQKWGFPVEVFSVHHDVYREPPVFEAQGGPPEGGAGISMN